MPKLTDLKITARNSAGEVRSEIFPVSVSSAGEFRAQLRSHLLGDNLFLGELAEQCQAVTPGRAKAHRVKLREHEYLESTALLSIETILKATLAKIMEATVVTERVILYSTMIEVHFCYDVNGDIHRNGYEAGPGCRWSDVNTVSNMDTKHYQVGLWAQVYDKVTSTRGDAKTIEYKWAGSQGDDEAAKLNGFCKIARRISAVGAGGHDHGKPYQEMPYTPEAAAFFSAMLMSMCVLAERISDFFGDSEKLQQRIASGTAVPLLTRQT